MWSGRMTSCVAVPTKKSHGAPPVSHERMQTVWRPADLPLSPCNLPSSFATFRCGRQTWGSSRPSRPGVDRMPERWSPPFSPRRTSGRVSSGSKMRKSRCTGMPWPVKIIIWINDKVSSLRIKVPLLNKLWISDCFKGSYSGFDPQWQHFFFKNKRSIEQSKKEKKFKNNFILNSFLSLPFYTVFHLTVTRDVFLTWYSYF